MKENLSRMLRSGVAVLLVLCMVAGFVPTAVFAAEVKDGNGGDIINYVSFGASNVNGYGLEGYIPAGTTAANKDTANVYGYQRMPEGSYPYLIAAALNEAAGGEVSDGEYNPETKYDPFEKVDVDQLAMSSMRMEELRFLLDDTYPGDKYTDWRFYDVNGDGHSQNWFGKAEPAGIEALRATYAEAITNADVITLDMGINNFGVFMDRAMSHSVDIDINAIDPEIAAQYAQAKAFVKQTVAQYSGEAALLLEGMDHMIDSLAFTLVGFCTSFDVVMGKIQELNPDATVVVVSIQNLLTGLSLEMPGFEQTLPLDQIFGAVINAANLYTAGRSPYRDSYLYTDVRKSGRVNFFIDDLLAYNGNPSTLTQNMIDCYNVYDDDLHAEKNIRAMVDSFLGSYVAGAFDDTEKYLLGQIYESADLAVVLGGFLADGAKGFANATKWLKEQAHFEDDEVVAATKKYEEVYKTYNQMKDLYTPLALNVGYDVLTEIFREGVEDHTLSFAALSSSIKGDVEDNLLAEIGGVLQTAVAGLAAAEDKENYNFDINEAYPDGFFETLAANNGLDAKLVKTIACMGIRTGIGNSFYGHPTPYGHKQIANAILKTLEEDITGGDVVEEEVKIVLSELYDLIQKYGPEVAAQVWAQWEEYGYVDMVETSISELKAMLDERYTYYTETALPAIDASVKNLSAQKDALTAELTALKAELAAKQAELEAVVNGVEIGDIYVPDINIDVELGNNTQTIVPGNDCAVDGEDIEAELEAAVKDIEHAIAVIEALIADVEADIADMIALAEQIAAAVAELEKTMASVAEAAEDVEAAVNAVIDVIKNSDGVVDATVKSFEAARATAEAAVEVLSLTMATAEELMADVDTMIGKIAADAETLYNKFMNDLPGCIEAIPDEAKLLIAGSVYAVQQAYEANKEEIKAALTAELTKLAEEYNINEATIKAELDKLTKEYEASKAAVEAELTAIEAKIAAEVEAKFAEIEAEYNAQIEAAKAEAAAKLAALEEELKGYQAELEALAEDAAEEVKAGIQAQIDRVNADIATVKADLEHAVSHLENAAEEAYNQIVEEVTKVYEETVAALEQKLAELKVAYDEAVAAIEQKLAELKAAYDKAVEDLTAEADKAIAELTDALNKTLEDLGKIGEALADEINGILIAIRKELTDTQKAIEEILKGNLAAIEDLKDALVEMGGEAIVDAVEALNDAVMALIEKATTADLVIDDDFKYVAIGDGSAAPESYVEKVTAALNAEAAANGVDEIEMVNYAKVGNTVTAERANLSNVTDADLITVGFSNVEFMSKAIANMSTGAELDWAAAVGEENVQYVDQLLAEVAEKITEAGIEGDYAIMANNAIEAYAYAAVLYATELPELVNEIHAVNPDAVIIIVGMYNPMDGVIINLGENATLDIGEYVDYLVKGVGVHGVAYSILTGNSIYVDAPAVQTVNTDTELGILDLLTLMQTGCASLYPSAVGDDYIAAEIADALRITYVKSEESFLYGDVNRDGKVDGKDLLRLQRYLTGENVEADLKAANVNGDGKVDGKDLLRLQRYLSGEQGVTLG